MPARRIRYGVDTNLALANSIAVLAEQGARLEESGLQPLSNRIRVSRLQRWQRTMNDAFVLARTKSALWV